MRKAERVFLLLLGALLKAGYRLIDTAIDLVSIPIRAVAMYAIFHHQARHNSEEVPITEETLYGQAAEA